MPLTQPGMELVLSKTLLSPVAPLSFSLPVCAVGQVGLWISDYKTPGVSESRLWALPAPSGGLPAAENACSTPREQIWWVV